MARTTNRLEGGVNSVVKDVLRNHRGLPEEHMRRACEWVCYMKTAHPRPESFIPDALRKGEKATTPEPDDSVAPAYGTGIDWNEFTPPRDTPTPPTDNENQSKAPQKFL